MKTRCKNVECNFESCLFQQTNLIKNCLYTKMGNNVHASDTHFRHTHTHKKEDEKCVDDIRFWRVHSTLTPQSLNIYIGCLPPHTYTYISIVKCLIQCIRNMCVPRAHLPHPPHSKLQRSDHCLYVKHQALVYINSALTMCNFKLTVRTHIHYNDMHYMECSRGVHSPEQKPPYHTPGSAQAQYNIRSTTEQQYVFVRCCTCATNTNARTNLIILYACLGDTHGVN